MTDYELSEHAAYVLGERGIRESWVKLTIQHPERTEKRLDGTVHYLRAIEEIWESISARHCESERTSREDCDCIL